MDVKNAQYHRASLSVHAGVYRGLRDEHGFSKEECAFMERAHDFVYTKWGHIEAFADVVIRDCPKLVQRVSVSGRPSYKHMIRATNSY